MADNPVNTAMAVKADNDTNSISSMMSAYSKVGGTGDENGRNMDELEQEYFKTVPEEYRIFWSDAFLKKERLCMHMTKFTVGILYGTAITMIFPYWQQFLNVPSSQVNIVSSFVTLAFSIKIFYGFLSDSVVIMGKRRKPYIILGWTLTLVITLGALIYVVTSPKESECYYSTLSDTERRVYYQTDEGFGPCATAKVESLNKPDGTILAVFFLIQNIAYMFADVAIDSTSIEWAQRENPRNRGRIQANNYTCRACGFLLSAAFAGLGLNSKVFGGDFDSDIGMAGVLGFELGFVAINIPFVYFFKEESLRDSYPSFTTQLKQLFVLSSDKAFGSLMLFNLLFQIFVAITPKAYGQVRNAWVDISPGLKSFNDIFGYFITAGTIYISGVYLTNMNWRMLQGVSTFIQILVQFLFVPIVLGGLRNPWYYIFVNMDLRIIQNISYMVNLWVSNELVLPGLEGTGYSMCTTSNNVALTLAETFLTNILGNPWPSQQTLEEDRSRWDYFYNLLVAVGVNLVSLVFLIMLPRQKAHAKVRKETWGRSKPFGIFLLSVAGFVTSFALVTTIGGVFCPDHTFFGGTESTCNP